MSRLLSQDRAQYALEHVRPVAQREDSDFKAGYARWCKRLPAMVMGNGLGQALAFLRADGGLRADDDRSSLRLYEDISKWVLSRQIFDGAEGDLLDALCNGERSQYVRAQRETLELLGWLKRFAEAYIGKVKES